MAQPFYFLVFGFPLQTYDYASILDRGRPPANAGNRFKPPCREHHWSAVVALYPDDKRSVPRMPRIDNAARLLVVVQKSIGLIYD